MAKHARVHHWAQSALDEYNGQYRATEILERANQWTIYRRNGGNSEIELAIADHYLFCRWGAAKGFIPGALFGAALALGYDGALKLIDEALRCIDRPVVTPQTGNLPPSRFDRDMLRWDMQGLEDGVADFLTKWGKVSLKAPAYPGKYLAYWID